MSVKYLQPSELSHLSFPDSKVLRQEFLSEEAKLDLYLDSAWLSLESGNGILGEGHLTLQGWSQLLIRVYDPSSKNWKNLDSAISASLKDICEFITDNQTVTLRGFSATTGLWTEWCFLNPTVSAAFQKP